MFHPINPVNHRHLDIAKEMFSEAEDFSWLDTKTPQNAFLCCVGSGPWKFTRRWNVINAALQWGTEKVFHESTFSEIYPLTWQNSMLSSAMAYCKANQINFNEHFYRLKEIPPVDWKGAIQEVFNIAGCPQGSKVLWLFVRDYLKLPAFPIDRHVARRLVEFGLPQNEWMLIDICLVMGLDPRKVAKRLVQDHVVNPEINT
ncbi:hypothetical protein [Ewingella americana]|uniref:Uncharacterized protein n=1 Tax=Ewingella americana TaxID=41202 RepID=A0A502GE04_9GAMM|nr:hypothetical protein [Ewingella americana]TPG59981.1 hypothetical protein EAH77_15555 [Ewingella americana]